MNATTQGTPAPFVFQNTRFEIVDRNGQQWLRLPQIGEALGYARSYKVQQIYERHAAEFTTSMTAVVKLPTAGGEQETRIFSLRGAHLLGMFARTAIAADFRRWVLDILDKETGRYDALQAHLSAPVPTFANRRWLIVVAPDGRESATPLAPEHFITKIAELPAMIRDPGFMIDGSELLEIVHACADRIAGKLAGGAHRIAR